jgi:(p)ppGpp synthase/HD superfamily hydrolase
VNGLAIKNLAHAIAVVAHDGQSRKGLGEPYIEHVERVADAVYGWKSKSIAYLHDVLEDTDVHPRALVNLGLPEDVITGVQLLTRPEGVEYADFIGDIISSKREDVIKIKIADIEDNLRDIDSTEHFSKKKRYMKALVRLTEALEGDDN